MSSDIDELRRELDIVSVVSDYIRLERSGTSYRANCPFHPDKTPSFYVSPSKQIFKCFGCGVGGDAIRFVSLYENVSYVQAAKELARKHGIKLNIGEDVERNKLHPVLEEISLFYHSKLKENRDAVEYLRQRGIENATVRRFMLGYAPTGGDLIKFLKSRGELELYERTGNIVKIEEGRYRDLFRGRLVIPIRDVRGNFVGFGGRSLLGEVPKYINSPESELFTKRSLLFGIYEGVAYLRELKSAVVVEGYFDVIALHQEGIRNAVATLGTSFGREHARTLSGFVEKVFLVFDGDEAGRRAVRIAVPHLLAAGLEVYTVWLPEGTDPCEFVLRDGKKAFERLLKSSGELFETLLREVETGERREEAIKDFLYFVSFVEDGIKAYSLLLELSKVTAIPVDVLALKVFRRKEEKREEREEVLSFTERLFLRGLLHFKPDIDLNQLRLSYRARTVAESILREELHDVPEEVLNLRTSNLERDFEEALRKLSIDISDELVGTSSVREAVREAMRKHGGGIRSFTVRRWKRY
ncbi:MAG TPA: DNA primase [Aquifex aeolicus]|nr:DNA primase [Aquifex aeolicus]